MAAHRAYLDYNASAPIRPEALMRMVEILGKTGNASSIHNAGRAARAAIETAREQLAQLCGTVPSQITFTSGATESNNAVLSCFRGESMLISAIEHPSVLEAATDPVFVPVDEKGVVNLDALGALVEQHRPALLSLMLVNNETGIIQPVAEAARLARKIHPAIHIHTDAAQAIGRMTIDFPALSCDYLSLSSHKFGGPQGNGALISAPGARPARLLSGGGQERRQRAGTENVAGIAAFGIGAAMAMLELPSLPDRQSLRDDLEARLLEIEPRVVLVGRDSPRVWNTALIALPGIAAETQLMALDLAGIDISSGSACSSGTVRPSHVLTAMGYAPDIAGSALRLSLGWRSTQDDIDQFVAAWTAMRDRVQDRILTPPSAR